MWLLSDSRHVKYNLTRLMTGGAKETWKIRKPKKRVLVTTFGTFLIFVLVLTVFMFFTFRTIEVQGESMQPTFDGGERLLVSKAYWLVGEIERDDIVVVKRPDTGEVIIKRVHALSGDQVDLLNVPDPENYPLRNGPYIVPDKHIYVMGDNLPMSEDSRRFGPVPRENVIGKVIVWNSPLR
jgi:signal peptidase I